MHALSLFATGDDLPLFSGTPPRAEVQEFVPRDVIPARQIDMFAPAPKCAFCSDTGWVSTGKHKVKRCLCGAAVLQSRTE